jgi:hypothetical protein
MATLMQTLCRKIGRETIPIKKSETAGLMDRLSRNDAEQEPRMDTNEHKSQRSAAWMAKSALNHKTVSVKQREDAASVYSCQFVSIRGFLF